MSRKLPVLVIGAGPTGLVSAISLLRSGVPVRVIEKLEKFHGGIRGTAIMPRTQEALAFIGVAQDVLDISTPPLNLTFYEADGRTAKEISWSEGTGTTQHFPFPEVRSVSQAEFEAVLRKHLDTLGVHVETGKELVALGQDEEKVTARILDSSTGVEETALYSFVVGADGAKGRTRRMLGIPFIGQTREEDRILSGSLYVTGLDKEHWHMWGTLTQAAFGLKPMKTGTLFQMQAVGHELPAELPTDLEGIRKLFRSISNRDDIIIDKAEWVSEWRANIRMCERFGVKRIFLVGDAAHCHSPFGGQGMNSGIQDAINLSWKITLVYHGHASRELLDTYTDERVPVIAEMLNLSSSIHYLAFGKPVGSALDGATKREVTNEEIMHRPKTLLQLGVNYRWSPIVLETREGASTDTRKDPYGQETDKLRAGDRAPDAPVTLTTPGTTLQDSTLHKLLDMRRHVALIFVSVADTLPRVVEELETIRDLVVEGVLSVAVILPSGTETSAETKASLLRDVPPANVKLLVDKDAEARRVYDIQPTEATVAYVVVRPDGVVGAFAGDAAGVRKYFDVLKVGGRG